MTEIAPAILAANTHQFREQIERVAPFATRLHIDLTDGKFAKTKTPGIRQIWWPHTAQADFHIMYKRPLSIIDDVIELRPNLVIVHAEAEGAFNDLADQLHDSGIKVGVALLPETEVFEVEKSISKIDHVLIFSGDLGKFGGKVDLNQLRKVEEIRNLNQHIEIGWDGGVNTKNAAKLVDGGINVLNVGGFIQRSQDPKERFEELQKASHRS